MRYYREFSADMWSERVEKTHGQIAPFNFSSRVLAREPEELKVLPLEGIRWSDWGTPDGVLMSLDAMGWRDRLRKPAPRQKEYRPELVGQRFLQDARL